MFNVSLGEMFPQSQLFGYLLMGWLHGLKHVETDHVKHGKSIGHAESFEQLKCGWHR